MSDSLTIQELVDLAYEKYASTHDGQVATYIPELGNANPR
jgi:glutaminase